MTAGLLFKLEAFAMLYHELRYAKLAAAIKKMSKNMICAFTSASGNPGKLDWGIITE
jgi:hypothetical protein